MKVTLEHIEDSLKILGPDISTARSVALDYAKRVGVLIVEELGGDSQTGFSFITKPTPEVTTGILRGPDPHTDLY